MIKVNEQKMQIITINIIYKYFHLWIPNKVQYLPYKNDNKVVHLYHLIRRHDSYTFKFKL